MNKMDRYLACLFVTILAFVAVMICLFIRYQSTPDTLIVSVFGLAGGECGIMGLIKRAKERSKEDDGNG